MSGNRRTEEVGMAAILGNAMKWFGALASLALIVGGGFWSYRLGVRDATELPVSKATEGPMREQPEDPGGDRAANQGLEVNSVLSGAPPPRADAGGRTAPPPEELLPDEVPAGNVVEQPAEPAERVSPAAETDAAPVEELPDAAFDADGNLVTSRPPRVRPVSLRTDVDPTTEIDRMIAGTQPTLQSGAEAGSGKTSVNLGTFASADIARQQWSRILAENGDLLGGRESSITETRSGGRTVYRLQVAGFESFDDGKSFCSALQARSISCTPTQGR
ncbi:MAG: SPOR domain-containing protein [Paracoccaceae bacterium]